MSGIALKKVTVKSGSRIFDFRWSDGSGFALAYAMSIEPSVESKRQQIAIKTACNRASEQNPKAPQEIRALMSDYFNALDQQEGL